MNQHASLPSLHRQRGAVVILLGAMLVVLIGFIGLAIDLGRFFVIKSELQNAMDACALSAASQLKPGANDPNTLIRAVAYGNVFNQGSQSNASVKNLVNFQSTELKSNVLEITFATTNDGTYQSAANADPNTAKFVKCNYPLADLPIYFMRVLDPLLSTSTVSAFAVATREAPFASCLPVAVCSSATGTQLNNFGYTVGQWMTALDGSAYGTGHFGWASLTSPASAAQLKDELTGSVQCNVSDTSQTVHGQGLMAGLAKEWNTRFGLYAPSMNPDTAPADHTGFAYSDAPANPPLPAGNWPPVPPATEGFNAYSGSNPPTPNFVTATITNRPYDTSSPQPPDFPVNQYSVSAATGRTNRRIVTAPIVDCRAWDTTPPATKSLPVQGWACVLMLNPYDESGPPTAPRRFAKLEFLGLASAASSPCSGGSPFAIAPVLTQ